jgi:hypothetical protein
MEEMSVRRGGDGRELSVMRVEVRGYFLFVDE